MKLASIGSTGSRVPSELTIVVACSHADMVAMVGRGAEESHNFPREISTAKIDRDSKATTPDKRTMS